MKFYIPHKLKIGDITHLADNDSMLAISQGISVEEIVDIQTNEYEFKGVVTDISTNSVEVEIIEQTSERKKTQEYNLTIMQAVTNEKKFNFFLQKAVELGVNKVIPIETELSLHSIQDTKKEYPKWQHTIAEAMEQSRNIIGLEILHTQSLNSLRKEDIKSDLKICLATENVDMKDINSLLTNITKNIIVAIGPESGWGVNDIKKFKELGFVFTRLKGNILRTETTGLVIATIIKFIWKQL